MQLPDGALWLAFRDGQAFLREDGDTETARIADAAAIALPSGRVVITDPVHDLQAKALDFEVEPDTYPVFLSLIRDEVALVMIYFDQGEPASWRETTPECFGVDSGMAAIMDQKVSRFLLRKAIEEKCERYLQRFTDSMLENDDQWGNVILNSESGTNVISFKTFGGDGVWPTFLGLNKYGEAACLIVDMFVHHDWIVGPVLS